MGARFWSKVGILNQSDCWEWMGGKRNKGYGSFWLNGRHVVSHRLAWELTNGQIPDGLMVLHKCDNTGCCNPSHLFLGTHHDNMDDMVKKGRQARWVKRTNISPSAKMTTDQVLEIRSLKGSVSQRKLADMFGISQAAVWKILSNNSWSANPTPVTDAPGK